MYSFTVLAVDNIQILTNKCLKIKCEKLEAFITSVEKKNSLHLTENLKFYLAY